MDDLLAKLARLEQRFCALEEQLADPVLMATPEYPQIMREHARLSQVALPYRDIAQAQHNQAGSEELLSEPDMRELAEAEIAESQATITERVEFIKDLLAIADPMADRPALLEIRAGTGGDEAALFAGDLARMYQMFCQDRGWKFTSLSVDDGEAGGIKEGVFQVSGEGAYGLMRFESGGHRVQRVPATESQGRVHTSAATVAVMAEAEAVDVEVDMSDVDVDTYRASGAGGQHVNKTDSAVRLTHRPSGVVVTCQDQKSQHANKDRALKILYAKLYEFERQRQHDARSAERAAQVGTGDRSDRIRTYNFPQNRISDHRVNYTAYNLDRVLSGHLEDVQRALIDDAKSRILDDWDGSY